MSGAAIQTDGLTKTYKNKKKTLLALDHLSLEIKEGETFGFIGPNGAGKTTAIKILIGLTFATSGKASLFGESVLNSKARNAIGYLSEVAAYSPHFEAEELLCAFGAMQGLNKIDCGKRAEELLKLVGLFERRKSRLGEFSKGMLQRFGIAQALLHNPKLVILDEPTSGLDPIAQHDVLKLLHDLKAAGMTIFFSSHRLTEVEGLCDHVGIINKGGLIFHGTIPELEAKESTVPFNVRFKLGEGVQQETVECEALHRQLSKLISGGATILSVSPARSSLEEIFVKMVTR